MKGTRIKKEGVKGRNKEKEEAIEKPEKEAEKEQDNVKETKEKKKTVKIEEPEGMEKSSEIDSDKAIKEGKLNEPNESNPNENDSDYNSEEDDDYDMKEESDESDDDEAPPDYNSIQGTVSQIKTRRQAAQEETPRMIGRFATDHRGLVQINTSIDVDSVFEALGTDSRDEWRKLAKNAPSAPEPKEPPQDDLAPKKVRIDSSYTFAGKLVTESKLVDADSAEAKAFLNSTAALTQQKSERSYVPILRTIPGQSEPVELRIKLKRPSLIDKVLGSKKSKLSTLEKSRLDWASFVDERKLSDELRIGNRGGYLDKQEFLGRTFNRREEQYQRAKEEERKRLWRKNA